MSHCRYQEEKKEETTIDNSNDNFLDPTIVVDRENKLQMVLKAVADNLAADSKHQDIRYIHAAIQGSGDRLQGKVLSGGYTNYSYQLFLEKEPNKKLFAKVCFAYALWCPGEEKKYYDLGRQICEFDLMKEFSEPLATVNDDDDGAIEDSPVVKPYLLVDIYDDIRLLVTQWADSTDEQWVNQFIDGEVDHRVLPKLATAMAKISLTEVKDNDYNKGMLSGFREMMAEFNDIYNKLFEDNAPDDECVAYLKSMGKERFLSIQESMHLCENKNEYLVHGDSHIFNILVEGKPDIQQLRQFGQKGSLVICDWEMAHVSCHGFDLRLLFYVPIACAYIHAALGCCNDKAQDIIDCLNKIWDVYAAYMVDVGNKDESFLRETFIRVIGFTGMRLFCILYALRAQIEHLDNGDLTSDEMDRVLATIGLTGIKFQEFGFGSDAAHEGMDLQAARDWFDNHLQTMLISSVEEEAVVGRRAAARSSKASSRRRSSLLRESNRRFSDASFLDLRAVQLSLLGS